MELPLFPLHTVLLPGGVVPLRIFETRYIDMIGNCMRNDSGFGVCLLHSGAETGVLLDFHRIGTLAKIIDWETLPDGLLGITAQGQHKIAIGGFRVQADSLLIGEVEFIADEQDTPLPEDFEDLAQLIEAILPEIGPPYSKLTAAYDKAGWVGGRLVELLPLEPKIKQALLEINNPLERLARLRDAVSKMR